MKKRTNQNPQKILPLLLLTSLLLTPALTYNPLKVIKLSDRNIKIAIRKYQRVIILFHSKWCNHSKRAIQQLLSLASSSHSEEIRKNRVVIAHYLSRENNEILTELKVKSYPTLRMYIEGSEIYFNKPEYTVENFVEFVREILNLEMGYLQSYKKLVLGKEPKVVFYGSENSFRFPIFRAAMYRFPELEFVHVVSNKKHIKKTNLKDNTINIVRENEDLVYYRKAWDQNRVNEWIFHSLNPSIIELDEGFSDLILQDKNPAFLLIVISRLIFILELWSTWRLYSNNHGHWTWNQNVP